MRCCECKRYIAAGVAAQKMIVEYLQDDGTSMFFGFGMSDGPLTQATGRIFKARHHKCYHVVRKREARGNPVTGRVLAGIPTAYQAGETVISKEERLALGVDVTDEAHLSADELTSRLARLHQIAARIGKAVGDASVMEAFWAEEAGGPYEHGHTFRLEPYQLMSHLFYAHGVGTRASQNWAKEHEQLHAKAQQQLIARIRNTEKEAPVRDWRDQFTGELRERNQRG